MKPAAGELWWHISDPRTDDGGLHDFASAERVCRAGLTLLRPRLTSVVIDAYTDLRRQLKDAPVAAAAQDALRRRGAAQHRRDPGMGVGLDPTRDDDWALATTYAPWSINVDLYTGNAWAGEFHDCGHAVTLCLTEGERQQLAERIGPDLTLSVGEPPDRAGTS